MRSLVYLSTFLLAGALCALPAAAQDECIDACSSNLCLSLGIDAGYEEALRELYGIVPLIGSNVDAIDLNFDGIKDVAEARMLDAVLADRGAVSHCCVYNPFIQNRIASAILAGAIVNAWPAFLGEAPEQSLMEALLAGATTSGNADAINSVVGFLGTLIPDLPEFDIDLFNGSAIIYLNADGDIDADGVCNAGEYNATVSAGALEGIEETELAAFVAAALDDGTTGYGGGCPDCYGLTMGEGEGEIVAEGEGETEGDGIAEGEAEGEVVAEGEAECDIASATSYFLILLALAGDENGELSKSELEFAVGLNGTLVDVAYFFLDTSGNDELSLGEFTAADNLLDLLPSLDDNGDNEISLSELQAVNGSLTQTELDAADANNNGVIDCDDLYGSGEGEAEGSAEGEVEGAAEGEFEGGAEGETEGAAEGESEGDVGEGESEGESEGSAEGESEGDVGEGESEGTAEGESEGVAEGASEGESEGDVAEGASEGESEGDVGEGESEGTAEGSAEGEAEGAAEGESEGGIEGESEGNSEGGTEGAAEGAAEGSVEGADDLSVHTADQDANNLISLSELLRVIQFFNTGSFSCAVPPESTEDGFQPGTGDQSCRPHSSDYNPEDWSINLSELLRLIQFFNGGGYNYCPDEDPATEDGYCVGAPA